MPYGRKKSGKTNSNISRLTKIIRFVSLKLFVPFMYYVDSLFYILRFIVFQIFYFYIVYTCAQFYVRVQHVRESRFARLVWGKHVVTFLYDLSRFTTYVYRTLVTESLIRFYNFFLDDFFYIVFIHFRWTSYIRYIR